MELVMVMKKEWSGEWIRSRQPRKQRKYRYNAPLHVRNSFLSAHLSETLKNRFGKRSLPLRKGDEVKVLRGENRNFKGKVERVDLKKHLIFIEGLNVKKVDGSEVLRHVHPSNLVITEANMDDKRRQAVVERARKAGEGKKTDKKEEKKQRKDKKEKSK